MTAGNKPTPEAIRLQVERILQSGEFRGSDKQWRFLSFVVEETLAGRASQLKGYTIALAVYGRKEGFDPQVDPIIRVGAGRLQNLFMGDPFGPLQLISHAPRQAVAHWSVSSNYPWER